MAGCHCVLEGSSLLKSTGRNLCETNWDGVWGLLSFKHMLLCCSLPQLCVYLTLLSHIHLSHLSYTNHTCAHPISAPLLQLLSLALFCCSQPTFQFDSITYVGSFPVRAKSDQENACKQGGLWGNFPVPSSAARDLWRGAAGWCGHPDAVVGR